MQPHTPFRSRPDWFAGGDDAETNWGRCFFELSLGQIPMSEFRVAYRDNLAWVLEDVKLLADNCDGAIAITADHGNGLGEWGVYGHPGGVPVPAVREVPYLTLEGNDERTLTPSLGAEQLRADVSNRQVQKHLEQLGYR